MIKRVDSGGQAHLVTNIRKPLKWRRYEYLLSSGTLRIDTGYLMNGDNYEINIDAQLGTTNETIYGFQYTTLICTLFQGDIYWNGTTTYGTNRARNIGTASTFTSRFTLNIKANNGTINYKLNSTTGSYACGYTSFSGVQYNMHLFASNYYNSSPRYSTGRIYRFYIKQNDNLIRDFVPAEYNGLYGMWDLVEDKFYGNAGTGTFTVGPEIKNYDEVDYVVRGNDILPAGVELYDYILSSGTLWIDTEYIPKGDFGTEIKFQLTTTSSFATIWGSMPSSSLITPRTGFHNYPLNYWMAGINATSSFGTANTNVHTLKLTFNNGTETMILDGSQVYTATPGATVLSSNNLSIGLFARNLNPISNYTAMKCYYFSINDGSKLIRNFLPCTYLGEPGMWDTVENKFYRNQGTGLFTLGSKIVLKEYEYLQGTGTQQIDTGISTTSNVLVTHECQLKLGANPSGSQWMGAINGGYWGVDSSGYWGAAGASCGAIADTNIHTVKVDILTTTSSLQIPVQVDGNRYFSTRSNSVAAGTPIGLFAIQDYISSYHLSNGSRIYWYKLYENNQLVRDFIPASYNGEYGLWDKVEWKFYGNAGTGSFTVGKEIGDIYPVSYLYDRTIYEEPDGSKWLRIAHHNNPSTRRFTSSDSFTTYVHTNEHLFFDVSWCNIFTTWELMVKQKTTSSAAELKFRWVLNYNPMTATYDNTKAANITYNTSSGYITPGTKWGGLMKINSDNTYLCGNNGTNGNWWGATGCKVLYLGGLPGWNRSMVTTGYIDLYIRIA